MNTTTTLDQMRNDYDWQQAFEYAGNTEPTEGFTGSRAGFTMDDVKVVLASDEGENDGQNWIAVLELKDGRFAFLEAGCDYTGWDCQASGRAFLAASLEDLVRWGISDTERPRVMPQLHATIQNNIW